MGFQSAGSNSSGKALMISSERTPTWTAHSIMDIMSFSVRFSHGLLVMPLSLLVVNLIESDLDMDDVYVALQEWINGLNKNPSTVKLYFGHIRRYLYYRGIKISTMDARQNLIFRSTSEEEMHPLSEGEFRRMLGVCDRRHRILYLAQLSSGMRIGELMQIRKEHLNLDTARIMVKIPANITKRRRGRTTLFSQETADLLLELLDEKKDSDLVFTDAKNLSSAVSTERGYLNKLLKEIKLSTKYESNGRHTITSHSFRAYFITRMSRKDPNLAKLLAGQKGYMLQYDRLTDEEKLAKYMEYEPDLLVWNRKQSPQGITESKPDHLRVIELERKTNDLQIRITRLETVIMKQHNLIPDADDPAHPAHDPVDISKLQHMP